MIYFFKEPILLAGFTAEDLDLLRELLNILILWFLEETTPAFDLKELIFLAIYIE